MSHVLSWFKADPFPLTCCWNLLESSGIFNIVPVLIQDSSFKFVNLWKRKVLLDLYSFCVCSWADSREHLCHYGMSWTGCFLLLYPALIDCFYINSNTHSNKCPDPNLNWTYRGHLSSCTTMSWGNYSGKLATGHGEGGIGWSFTAPSNMAGRRRVRKRGGGVLIHTPPFAWRSYIIADSVYIIIDSLFITVI